MPIFNISKNGDLIQITELVDNILISVNELHNLEQFYYDSLFDYDGYLKNPKLVKINQNAIIISMDKEDIQKLKNSKLLFVDDIKDDFKITNIDGIFPNLVNRSEDLKYHITINGTNKTVSIDGKTEELKLLIELLKERIGQNYQTVIDSTYFPMKIEKYFDQKKTILNKHFHLFKEVNNNQKEIDKIVLKLYGLKPSQIKFEALFSKRNN